MDKKQDPYICCLQETHLRPKDAYRLKVRGWKKIFHANGKYLPLQRWSSNPHIRQNRPKIKITRDKERHYPMIKGSVQEEDLAIVNIHKPNIGAPQHIRQILKNIKGEIDCNIIIVGDFNTQLTPMDRASKQKINKETQVLNDTLDEMGLIDIFRTLHPNAKEYTFLLLKRTWNILQERPHLGSQIKPQ